MEVLIAFCTIIVEECRYKGGKSKCSFWNPGVVFKDMDECTKDKKLIEDYVVEELWRIHPEAVKIYAKGVCFKEDKTKKPTGRNKGQGDRK
mgnify:FL=1|tara:strand:+ start:1159 stop:1431 length:273 start_codon:yes stop_codon:yes gene_type:complete